VGEDLIIVDINNLIKETKLITFIIQLKNPADESDEVLSLICQERLQVSRINGS